MSCGSIIVLRKGKVNSGPGYKLEEGDHTIGSSLESNIRLKIDNANLLDTHAVIKVSQSGVATLHNKSCGAPIRINGKIVLKPTILKHEDIFEVIIKQFQYLNEALKDLPDDSKIFMEERKKNLSRKSVNPLLKTPSTKKRSSLTTPVQRNLNCSYRTPVYQSASSSRLSMPNRQSATKLKTPMEKRKSYGKHDLHNDLVEECDDDVDVVANEVDIRNLTDAEKSVITSHDSSAMMESTNVEEPPGRFSKRLTLQGNVGSPILKNRTSLLKVEQTNITKRVSFTEQKLDKSAKDNSYQVGPWFKTPENSVRLSRNTSRSSRILQLSAGVNEDAEQDKSVPIQCNTNASAEDNESGASSSLSLRLSNSSNRDSEDEIPATQLDDSDTKRRSRSSSRKSTVNSVKYESSAIKSPKSVIKQNLSDLDDIMSRETTIDACHNSSKVSRNRSGKRMSTFDESTQEANPDVFGRPPRKSTTFEESTEEMLPELSAGQSMELITILDDTEEDLSPVKPLPSRRSTSSLQSDSSSSSINRRSSSRTTRKSLENSSLTETSLGHNNSSSAISVSSQSFSSYKKAKSDHDDTEIDVVNITSSTTAGLRKSGRFNSGTPVADEPLRRSMFNDVVCTSTPFHKHRSSDLNITDSEKSAKKGGSRSEVFVISSTDATLNVSKVERSRSFNGPEASGRPQRRSSSRSTRGDDCISCRGSMTQRSRSLSASQATVEHLSGSKNGYEAVSPVKKISSSNSKSGTPILHRKSNVLLVLEGTPEKFTNLEDETPKSHVKPSKRSSKINHSAYNPCVEDITPVTPEKLEVSGFTDQGFKTPINTPGLFESIRKSAINSRKRLRESTGSILKENKKARVDFSPASDKSQQDETYEKEPRPQKSPLNRLSDFEGVKRLMKTPAKSPKNDLRNIPNLRRIMSPKRQNSPKNDLTNPVGVKELMKSHKKQKSPKNDLTNPVGVKELMKSHKKQKSPKNDLTNPLGVRELMKSHKKLKEPKNDLSNISGVASIFNVSGVEVLHQGSDIENSEDLFTQLTGKRPVKSYLRGKSLSPHKAEHDIQSRKTMGDLPICSPRVQQWVEEHANMEVDKEKIVQPRRLSLRSGSLVEENRSKVGRSLSAKKPNKKEESSRRKTYGNFVSFSASETTTNQRRSLAGKSISPRKSIGEDSFDANVTNKSSRRSSRTHARSVSSNKSTSFRRNIDGEFASVEDVSEEDILENVSGMSNRRLSKKKRSISHNKSSKQDSFRRRTHEELASGENVSDEDILENVSGVSNVSPNISDKQDSFSSNAPGGSPIGEDSLYSSEEIALDNGESSISPSKSFKRDSFTRKAQGEFLFAEDDLENLSEMPTKMARKGRSVSPRKSTKRDSFRRKTHGEFLSAKDDAQDSEDDLENLSEMPNKLAKKGRSVSPKKPTKQDSFRRKTHGEFLSAEDNLQDSEDDLENLSEAPNKRMSNKGRSVSPRKSSKQDSFRRKTYGEFLSAEDDVWDSEDVLENLSEMPKKGISKKERSISPKKPTKQDSFRRKSHGEFLSAEDNVRDSEDDLENLSEAPNKRMSKKGRSISPRKSTKQDSFRRKTHWEFVSAEDNLRDSKDDFENLSEMPNKMARTGRSVSPKKPTRQDSFRRKTHGEFLSAEDNVQDSEDDLENLFEAPNKRMSNKGRSVSPRKSTTQDSFRRKTHGEFLSAEDNMQDSEGDLENLFDAPNKRMSKKGRSISPRKSATQDSFRRKTHGEFLSAEDNLRDSEDDFENLSEMPNKMIKKEKSVSPRKSTKQDSFRRQTHGEFPSAEDNMLRNDNGTLENISLERNKRISNKGRSVSPSKVSKVDSVKQKRQELIFEDTSESEEILEQSDTEITTSTPAVIKKLARKSAQEVVVTPHEVDKNVTPASVVEKPKRSRKGKAVKDTPEVKEFEEAVAPPAKKARGGKKGEEENEENNEPKKTRGKALKNNAHDTEEKELQLEETPSGRGRRNAKTEQEPKENKRLQTRVRKNDKEIDFSSAEEVNEQTKPKKDRPKAKETVEEIPEKVPETRRGGRRNVKLEETADTKGGSHKNANVVLVTEEAKVPGNEEAKTTRRGGRKNPKVKEGAEETEVPKEKETKPVQRGGRRNKHVEEYVAEEEAVAEKETKLVRRGARRNAIVEEVTEEPAVPEKEKTKPTRRGARKNMRVEEAAEEAVVAEEAAVPEKEKTKPTRRGARKNMKVEEAAEKMVIAEKEETQPIRPTVEEVAEEATVPKKEETKPARRGGRKTTKAKQVDEEAEAPEEVGTKPTRRGARRNANIEEVAENAAVPEKEETKSTRGRQKAQAKEIDEETEVPDKEPKPARHGGRKVPDVEDVTEVPEKEKVTPIRGGNRKNIKVAEEAEAAKIEEPIIAKTRGRKTAKLVNSEEPKSNATRSRQRKIEQVVAEQENTPQEVPKQATRGRGRKNAHIDEETEMAKEPIKTTRARGRKNAKTEEHADEPSDEEIEFNQRPTRGAAKKSSAPKRIVKEETPVNKLLEEVMDIEVDSPRSARAKRGVNPKYSADEYVTSTKRKVHFDDDTPVKEPGPKRTRRVKK